MGCSSVSNMYGKSEMLNKFFQQCELSGYSSSQIIKTTEYQYEYVRCTREWRKVQTKTIFNDQNPVLLGPVQFEQFEALKVQLKDAPNFKSENFSQVLQIGDVFPRFKATILNRTDQITFDTQLLKPTLFIFWKLDETKSLNPILYQTRSTINRFQDDKKSKFIQTAYQRAKVRLSEQYNLVGLCCDSIDKKFQYEQYIQQDETHIWLEDQSLQVFKYAEDEYFKIRSFENSIYLVNNGIFVVCLQENFSDQSFVEGINKHSLKKLDQQEIEFTRKEQFKKKIQFEIRRDDYQKLKQIILDSLPKKTNQMQIGDTFKLGIKKLTYYYNYRKCGATYIIPTLWAAGSQKYQIGFQELISWLRDQTPFAHLRTDFMSRHTMNKEKFFSNLSNQIKTQYNDMNFILEKTQMIVYDQNHKKFVLHRTLDQIYNTPLSVGSVFARKEFMQNLKIQTQDYVDNRLLKNYLQNPYIITTCFQIGSLYTPIPNLYKVTHNDQSVILSNTIKPQQVSKGIYDSKLMNSVISQNGLPFPDVEKIESNVSEIIECLEDQQDLQDLNYEQQDSLQHVNQEVLLIYIIDFKNQSENLAQLLEFINNNGWQNSQIRVAVISQQNDKDFEYSIHRYKLEKYMSNGLFEPWFPIQNTFLGVNFYRMLSDLYGLNQESPLIIIDQLKRVLFRGLPDKQFPTLLRKIMNGQSAKHIHAPDRALKHRIDKAQYQVEWYKLKSYGYQSIKYSSPIQEVIKYIQMQPLGANDIWMIKQTQFQLWNHEGIRKRKFYERPQVIYKFEKPEISVKFYHISDEVQNLLGKDRIDLLDIVNSKQIPQQYDNLIQ